MPDPDTDLAGDGSFPSTMWSRLIHSPRDPVSLDYLIRSYWKPAYLYVRRKWGRRNEDAKDLVQDFFARVLETGWLEKASPDKGSFRRFLKASLENFLRNAHRDAKAQKRGGGAVVIPLEALGEADALATREGDPEALFDREWLEAAFERTLPKLREAYEAEGKSVYWEVFRRYELERPEGGMSYELLARDLGIEVSAVRNYLHHARERWRRMVREELRETTSGPEPFSAEVRELFPDP